MPIKKEDNKDLIRREKACEKLDLLCEQAKCLKDLFESGLEDNKEAKIFYTNCQIILNKELRELF